MCETKNGRPGSIKQYIPDPELASAIRLMEMFESSNDFVIFYDEELNIVYASSFAVRVFRFECTTKADGIYIYNHSDWNCRAEWEDIVRSVFETGSTAKFRLQMQDCNWYAWTVILKQDKIRKGKYVLCHGINCTEEMDRKNELKTSLKHEKEFKTMISRFVSSVSYELRAELLHISLYSDLIERFYGQWEQEKVVLHLDKIRKSVDSLNYLIDKALVLNGTGLGSIPFNPEIIDLPQVMNECIDASKLFNACHLAFEYEYNCPRKNFVLDRLQFRFILINLIMLINDYSDIQGKCFLSVDCLGDVLEISIKGDKMNIGLKELECLTDFFSRSVESSEIGEFWSNRAVIKHALDALKAKIRFEEECSRCFAIILTIPELLI
ncbi:MAG: sensor histidine kinase [Bacteroidota bacterium]